VNTLIATRFLPFVVLILLVGTSDGRHVAGDKTQRNGSQKLLTRESLGQREGSTVAFSTAGSEIGSAWAQSIAALAETSRVSVASDGSQGNSHSRRPSISVDGRFLAFASEASNLVLDDTNGYADIFVHDRQTGQTSRVSVAADGAQANGESWNATIAADGRYVAFESRARNLVPGYINGAWNIFVHDRQTGQTSLVSVASDGTQGDCCSTQPSISADGQYVAFQSLAGNLVSGDTNGTEDIFVHDRQTGQTSRVSIASDGAQGNSDSRRPSISADGRHVAFDSRASNLVAGDINGTWDVFVHDRQTGQTSRVSVASDGTQGNSHSGGPSISADGRTVAFESWASTLVPGDTNNTSDIFVHERAGANQLSNVYLPVVARP
jgi:Tol biopolymer transport system component